MSNDRAPVDVQNAPAEPDDQIEFSGDKRSRISQRTLIIAIVGLIVLNVAAFILLPPFNPDHPDQSCLEAGGLSESINCLVEGTLHLPAPHVVEGTVLGGGAADEKLVTFQISLTDTLITMLVLTAIVIAVLILATLGRRDVPGFFQNFAEWAYESMSSWSLGMGGSQAARYIPIFAAFFILILAFNWSGLIPGIGILPATRAPTSDLNVTLGLALFAWFYFQYQGFRRLGVGGYMSKFFPFYEFKNGIGAGLIALFVGFVELILEFVKPVTLSMRLFGNIYGGEVALAIVTALVGILLVPVALYGLEIILTFVQALIFATLTLMFILTAIESHHEEDHEGEEATHAAENTAQGAPATS
ncbi:MAG: F0F1 ATP synthase subunit A [Chloroflexota bacterium]|nr:F0F1 ATP synthase subunit A [Chloroflexota bacterium]